MSDRGMKKWAPYKSLVEQGDSLNALHSRSEKVERPILSIDEEEEINEILTYYHGQEVEIKYYKNERIYVINTTIVKIDVPNRKLILPERKSILLQDLVGLKNI